MRTRGRRIATFSGSWCPVVWTVLSVSLVPSPATAAGFPWKSYQGKDDAWYCGDEGARLAEIVRSHQTPHGDWPKNRDTSKPRPPDERPGDKGTFDNGATVGETRFLARAYRAAGRPEDLRAVQKAIDHILAAQYPNGGWPQTFPLEKGYSRHITFNDGTFVNLLALARDAARSDDFAFLDQTRRDAAARAFDAGIQCILKCQIRKNGEPTVWCAQHDEITLEPRTARTYELPSLSGAESAGILLFLMSLENPSPEVRRAIRGGALWFARSRILGIRQVTRNGEKVLVDDPAAPPLWARFYDLDTNTPFFCGRDGVKKASLAEIEAERRNNYAWYGEWGKAVASRYEAWAPAHGEATIP